MLLAVLTVSDRCSQGVAIDTAGPAVAALLRQHWPEAEIATALDLTVSNVGVRIHRARARLRDVLEAVTPISEEEWESAR